ncbi:tRNA (guanosine(46)-N7)-methyltransferase TrmB [Galenea microaerophila]
MTTESIEPQKRRIKSFVLRQGRLSKAQQRALETQWPKFGVDFQPQVLNLSELFGRQAPTYLEIGFGMGKSLAEMAQMRPEHNFIGIEVHRPGVGALLKEVEERHLNNVRVVNHDAVEVLEQMIPDQSLAGVYLFFPDPWHKKRHHKRRIVQPEFVALIARKLQAQGIFHMATDWEDYAHHMMEVMTEAPDFENTQPPMQFTPRPDDRPLTKFETRGQRLGHGVWDLVFRKKAH